MYEEYVREDKIKDKTDEEKRRPSVNKEKCVGCHLCATVCPTRSISKGEIFYKNGDRKEKPIL